jgi:hypothetical protein
VTVGLLGALTLRNSQISFKLPHKTDSFLWLPGGYLGVLAFRDFQKPSTSCRILLISVGSWWLPRGLDPQRFLNTLENPLENKLFSMGARWFPRGLDRERFPNSLKQLQNSVPRNLIENVMQGCIKQLLSYF